MSEEQMGDYTMDDQNDLEQFSDANENGTEKVSPYEVTAQSIPKWLKWVIVMLIIIVLSVAITLFINKSSSTDSSELETQADTEITEEIPISRTIDVTKGIINEESLVYSSIESSLIEQPSETELKLIQLQEQLSQLIVDNNLRQDSQDAIIQGLESQLNAQLAQIDQLQTNLKTRQQAVKAKKKVHRTYRARFPFTLVSVDQWGNDLYAVVRLQGKLYEFTYGQGIKGWHVSTIDTSRGAVTFKNKEGSRKELLIKS